MKRSKIGLIPRIAILVGIIEFIAFILLGYLYSEKYFDSIKDNLRDRLHQVNMMLANEELPISAVSRDKFMTNLIGMPYLQGIVLGSNNYIIVSSKIEYLGKKPKVISGFQQKWLFPKAGENFFIVNHHLTSIAYLSNNTVNQPLYRTILSINIEQLVTTKNKIVFYSILVSFVFACISSLMIIFLAQRYVASRINKSLEVLNEVEKGNLQAQIHINQIDELGQLQQAINKVIKKVGNLLFQYQQSIKETEFARKELNDIIENIPNMVFVKDAKELRFVKFNKAGEDILGISRYELLGKNDYDLFPKEQADFFTQKDKQVIQNGTMIDISEEPIKTKQGRKILYTRKVLIKDNNGKPLYLLGVSEDITENKKTQKQLHEQEKIIEEQSKNAAMGEMIGNIAHQWRQPLSIISTGATGMLMQKQFDTLSDEQFEKTCNIINENAQYLSKTIDDFKNFIKNDRKFVKFNVKEIINKFLNLVEPSFKRHNIQIIVNIDPTMNIEGYPNELLQCFMNLFNNAKDALKESANHKKYIFIDSFKENNRILIKFKDNAGGIPENILPRIFEPYFTTKHQSQGTGLGLSMTYNLVNQGMNGTIDVKNTTFNYEEEFYLGAEFTIDLPSNSIESKL